MQQYYRYERYLRYIGEVRLILLVSYLKVQAEIQFRLECFVSHFVIELFG